MTLTNFAEMIAEYEDVLKPGECKKIIEKFEYFEMLSMITWGLWALRRSPNDNDGLMAINNAIKLSKIKKL